MRKFFIISQHSGKFNVSEGEISCRPTLSDNTELEYSRMINRFVCTAGNVARGERIESMILLRLTVDSSAMT
jgi:hypothetical protein